MLECCKCLKDENEVLELDMELVEYRANYYCSDCLEYYAPEVTCEFCGDTFNDSDEGSICESCESALGVFDDRDLVEALCMEFDCTPFDITDLGDGAFEINGNEYLVLTEDEADEKVAEEIEQSLWAFNSSFLSDVTGIDSTVFDAIQANNHCEGNNDAIMSILDATNVSMGEVAEEAIRWDGRGHFLNHYDGNEYEFDVNGQTYYYYRR